MHQEPWEPLEGPYPADRKPDPDASDADPPADGEVPRTPPSLLTWHVVEPLLDPIIEIEGEATLIEETEVDQEARESVSIAPSVRAQDVAARPTEPRAPANIQDQHDAVVVAGMPVRRVTVMPGAAAEFEVTVANHGRWPALFEVSVEGWIDEAWTPDLPVRVQLEPRARRVVSVVIQPPRHADCHAGDHRLVVVVRAARYPGHVTRLAATLVVERYAALKLGAPQPPELDVSWFAPAATMRLPVTNLGNYAATIHLQGVDRARHCDFTFYAGQDADDSEAADGAMGTAHVTLLPGQTVSVPVEIRTRQRPFVGIMPRMLPYRVVARMDTEPPLRRAVEGELAVAPLIGPWHLAIAAVLGVVALFGTGLAALALLVALRSNNPTTAAPPPAASPPVVAGAPAPPVVAFVIQMDQPMPTRAADGSNGEVTLTPAAQGAPDGANAAPLLSAGVPIVRADQVTAPGEPTPVGQQPLRPIVVTTPTPVQGNVPAADGAQPADQQAAMTYGQMFKQVASQFDLDWRLLAAQAYLESGFDSLALSGDGDMGLMQIRPTTWNEWAPTVEASDPFDSYSNVLVGAAYLNHLREVLSQRGLPQAQWMLVAYNWGPDKVFSHLDAGGTWETLDPERRQYADDILRIAASIPPS